jgi:hypothetical protein
MSGPFTLQPPALTWRPRSLSVGKFELKLDPRIEAEIRALGQRADAAPAIPMLRARALCPSWQLFEQRHLDWMLRQPLPTRRDAPLVPRGAGPASPRPGEIGDFAKAVWAVPAVQGAAGHVLDGAARGLRRGWDGASTGERVLVVSHAAVLGGGALTAVLSNRPARTAVLDFVSGKPIPVPGVEGLTLELRHDSAHGDYGGIVTFDLAPYLPGWGR